MTAATPACFNRDTLSHIQVAHVGSCISYRRNLDGTSLASSVSIQGACMILLWTPVTLSAVGASIFAAVFGVLVSHRKAEPVEHDAEREIQRLTQKLRQPWRARWHRLMGPD